MTRTRMLLAAATAATLWTAADTAPARAQYYDYREGYGEPYDDYGYERRRFRRRGGGRGGSVCVTARGNCVVPPAPFNAECGCEIPGFGFKRGNVGG